MANGARIDEHATPRASLMIAGGTVVDGTGEDPRTADLARGR